MPLFDSDNWREIIDSLRRHKLRTLLTAFGVFWGIFMLVNLMGVGKGLENGSYANFNKTKNAIFIWTGRPTSIPYKGLTKGRLINIKDDDLEAIQRGIPGVKYLAPANGLGSQYISSGTKGETFDIRGIEPVELEIRGYNLVQGRFLNDLDIADDRKITVIGQGVSEVLFGKENNPIGEQITILGVQFTVVGVVTPFALNNWAQRDLDMVFLPRSTQRKTFNQGDNVHFMIAAPWENEDAFEIENQIITLLQERHKIHPKDFGVVGSYNTQKNFDRVRAMFSGITTFSWIVAIGTIIAGVVGVGNIMLISVKERTKEIGIRKAIGATPGNIVGQIVTESLAITFVAGYFGLTAGVVSIEIIGKIFSNTKGGTGTFLNPEVSFTTAFAAILVLLFAGFLASLLPARKAALVDPVTALQDE